MGSTITLSKEELEILISLLGGIRVSVGLADADSDRYGAARDIMKKLQAAQVALSPDSE